MGPSAQPGPQPHHRIGQAEWGRLRRLEVGELRAAEWIQGQIGIASSHSTHGNIVEPKRASPVPGDVWVTIIHCITNNIHQLLFCRRHWHNNNTCQQQAILEVFKLKAGLLGLFCLEKTRVGCYSHWSDSLREGYFISRNKFAWLHNNALHQYRVIIIYTQGYLVAWHMSSSFSWR